MSLKHLSQSVLHGLGIYNRLKASVIYDAYFALVDDSVLKKRGAELSFYRRHLQGFVEGALVFDIGANHGQKADIFLRLGAKVIAVEPDMSNQGILRQKFLKGRLRPKPIIVVGKAVSDQPGTLEMFVDAPGSAKNTLSSKWVETLRRDDKRFGAVLNFRERRTVETTTLDELIAAHGKPFFIKIDVEGYEPNVLLGLHEPVPYISFEVNIPEFVDEGVECVNILERLLSRGTFNIAPQCEGELQSAHWLSAEQCRHFLRNTRLSSVEVFWRSGIF
jgi:FkbM family methyltransferase